MGHGYQPAPSCPSRWECFPPNKGLVIDGILVDEALTMIIEKMGEHGKWVSLRISGTGLAVFLTGQNLKKKIISTKQETSQNEKRMTAQLKPYHG